MGKWGKRGNNGGPIGEQMGKKWGKIELCNCCPYSIAWVCAWGAYHPLNHQEGYPPLPRTHRLWPVRNRTGTHTITPLHPRFNSHSSRDKCYNYCRLPLSCGMTTARCVSYLTLCCRPPLTHFSNEKERSMSQEVAGTFRKHGAATYSGVKGEGGNHITMEADFGWGSHQTTPNFP